MAERRPRASDVSLPFAALQLLAPPVRLVSAALLKVLKQRDVLQYGVVEEFVSAACDTVPGLLTVRHQGKLTLGLRGRLILELCRTQPDAKVIAPHMKRIRSPAVPSSSSAATVRPDVKIEKTVECFHLFIHALLTDPAEREEFFKEEFPVEYGPKFDQDLEKLLWEFLIRLDQLLPVPNLAQTVSWLSGAPSVLEECARSATQPQLLNILLQHQTCLGHLESAASLPPNMGDSILDSLSLPPSGKQLSNPPTGAKISAAEMSSRSTQTRKLKPFIAPVIGLISNKDVPVMISASKRALRADMVSGTEAVTNNLKFPVADERQKTSDDGVKQEVEEERVVSKSRGMKRKQPEQRQSEVEEEGDAPGTLRFGKKRISVVIPGRGSQGTSGGGGGGVETGGKKSARDELAGCMSQLGFEMLRLPEDPSLCSIFMSCLRSQPRVVIQKLPEANGSGRGGKSFRKEPRSVKKSAVKAAAHRTIGSHRETAQSDISGLDDKENHPVSPSISSSPAHLRTNTDTVAPPPADSEDYVADSEDEATKNFKGRLFIKRYYKTKHGTYVPTLREYWKPRGPRRELLSTGSKHR